jgi:hypothetical protein
MQGNETPWLVLLPDYVDVSVTEKQRCYHAVLWDECGS